MYVRLLKIRNRNNENENSVCSQQVDGWMHEMTIYRFTKWLTRLGKEEEMKRGK